MQPERSKDKRYQAQSLTRTALTTSQDDSNNDNNKHLARTTTSTPTELSF